MTEFNAIAFGIREPHSVYSPDSLEIDLQSEQVRSDGGAIPALLHQIDPEEQVQIDFVANAIEELVEDRSWANRADIQEAVKKPAVYLNSASSTESFAKMVETLEMIAGYEALTSDQEFLIRQHLPALLAVWKLNAQNWSQETNTAINNSLRPIVAGDCVELKISDLNLDDINSDNLDVLTTLLDEHISQEALESAFLLLVLDGTKHEQYSERFNAVPMDNEAEINSYKDYLVTFLDKNLTLSMLLQDSAIANAKPIIISLFKEKAPAESFDYWLRILRNAAKA